MRYIKCDLELKNLNIQFQLFLFALLLCRGNSQKLEIEIRCKSARKGRFDPFNLLSQFFDALQVVPLHADPAEHPILYKAFLRWQGNLGKAATLPPQRKARYLK